MKERPILFKGEMVRAILDGRKTQTRRLDGFDKINEAPDRYAFDGLLERDGLLYARFTDLKTNNSVLVKSPYGQPGDKLWVRETFYQPRAEGPVIYKANWREDALARGFDNIPDEVDWKWKPSIHMPRWASRIDLLIKDIRAPRLQDISEEDAQAEGVTPRYIGSGVTETAMSVFKNLWCGINGGENWDANPFCWVIEFERIRP